MQLPVQFHQAYRLAGWSRQAEALPMQVRCKPDQRNEHERVMHIMDQRKAIKVAGGWQGLLTGEFISGGSLAALAS